ncbi:MAG: LysR family transcriptional regulator [Pseudomonadota bacterium]
MNEMQFDWDDFRLFLAIAREGGLARAAAITGKSPPTLGRRMIALERQIGRDLFKRMAKGYALTEHGEILLKKAEMLEAQILPLHRASTKQQTAVKVSAGTWVTHYLCQRLPEITEGKGTGLRFISAEEVLNISHREALIGVRNHRPEGVGLAARKVGTVSFGVYARGPADVPWARVIGSTPSARWVQHHAERDHGFELTNPRNALDLVLNGQAKAVLPCFVGDQYDALQRVSDPIAELDHEQWLVTHNEDRHLPEIRAVIDRIFKVLKTACRP